MSGAYYAASGRGAENVFDVKPGGRQGGWGFLGDFSVFKGYFGDIAAHDVSVVTRRPPTWVGIFPPVAPRWLGILGARFSEVMSRR
jgi:hypothetical protein